MKDLEKSLREALERELDFGNRTGKAIRLHKVVAEQKAAIVEAVEGLINNLGNEPMPRIGKSGKYIKSPQSFQDGFAECQAEGLQAIKEWQ